MKQIKLHQTDTKATFRFKRRGKNAG